VLFRSIFITGRNGTIVRQVTNRAGYNTDVSWSPDGGLLVFSGCSATPCTAADYEIYTVDVNGASETRLTTNTRPDYDPSFSPNGRDIVWLQKTADAGNGTLGTWGIKVYTFQGGAQRTLIDDSQVNETPAWSADNAWVYFRRIELSVSSRWRIFKIKADATVMQELTGPGNNQYPGT